MCGKLSGFASDDFELCNGKQMTIENVKELSNYRSKNGRRLSNAFAANWAENNPTCNINTN